MPSDVGSYSTKPKLSQRTSFRPGATQRALSRLSLAEATAQGPLLHLRKRGGGALAAQLSHVAGLCVGNEAQGDAAVGRARHATATGCEVRRHPFVGLGAPLERHPADAGCVESALQDERSAPGLGGARLDQPLVLRKPAALPARLCLELGERGVWPRRSLTFREPWSLATPTSRAKARYRERQVKTKTHASLTESSLLDNSNYPQPAIRLLSAALELNGLV